MHRVVEVVVSLAYLQDVEVGIRMLIPWMLSSRNMVPVDAAVRRETQHPPPNQKIVPFDDEGVPVMTKMDLWMVVNPNMDHDVWHDGTVMMDRSFDG